MSWSRLGEILQDWLEGIESVTRGGNGMGMRAKWEVEMTRTYEYTLKVEAKDEDEARAAALKKSASLIVFDNIPGGFTTIDKIANCWEDS